MTIEERLSRIEESLGLMHELSPRELCKPVSNHNPRPPLEVVVNELTKECRKCHGDCGNYTHPVRIWILRRALEYLLDFSE